MFFEHVSIVDFDYENTSWVGYKVTEYFEEMRI